LFAIWIQVENINDENLVEIRNAALVELYGRQFRSKEFLHYGFENLHALINQVLNSIHVEIKATLDETLNEYMVKLKRLKTRSFLVEESDIFPKRIECLFYNLNKEKLCQIFFNMRPSIPAMTDEVWKQLLCFAIANPISFLRNTLPYTDCYHLAVTKLKHYILRQARIKARYHVIEQMNIKMTKNHKNLPFMFPRNFVSRYNEKYNCDLRVEYDLNENGYSKNSCMCSSCPFYGRKILEGQHSENSFFLRRGSVAEHTLAINNIIVEMTLIHRNASLLTLLQHVLQEMVKFSKTHQCFHLFADFQSNFKSPYIRMLSGENINVSNNDAIELQEYIRNKNQEILTLIMDAKTSVSWEHFEITVNNLRSIQEQSNQM
jgi:hypothetical protein